ncbi:MAG: SDR family NAD(P)-dependent oxidoreductase [Phenylobacterium sp.]|uniref:SDR family NAD(P)-dependent oxidoreductase n=1 Tax=Phenylobacterium sp. TaxID=1871053 RepID=UPI0025E5A2DB|nr:SDR family oxidoreductase [Phenylobacterium sp.]MBI1200536.1 SDR family NAD(P)-dependent oxidoreductase [Phenylobacterium sp.]
MSQGNKGAALVTGASSGIGAVYAERLARRGHDLVLAARDAARLEALAARLRAEAGVTVEVIRADLTVRDDLAVLESRLRDDPAIELLINNAGAAYFTPFAASDPDQLENLIQLNVVAVTRLAAAAAAGFVARGRGAIVNIGSIVGLSPEFKSTVYGATKAFVLYLTQSLNEELAGSGVRLQAVLPGATRTEIWDRSGRGIETVPSEILMDVNDLVDAAIAGFDQGELVTIPSLPDAADWQALEAARLRLGPNLSRSHPAARYGVAVREPA